MEIQRQQRIDQDTSDNNNDDDNDNNNLIIIISTFLHRHKVVTASESVYRDICNAAMLRSLWTWWHQRCSQSEII